MMRVDARKGENKKSDRHHPTYTGIHTGGGGGTGKSPLPNLSFPPLKF